MTNISEACPGFWKCRTTYRRKYSWKKVLEIITPFFQHLDVGKLLLLVPKMRVRNLQIFKGMNIA